MQITNKNRFKESEMVSPNITNKKYLEVIKLFIAPEYIWKTLKWVNGIDAANKRVSKLNSN